MSLSFSSPSNRDARARGAGVTAVLGPTNTGKTYLAIERMLAHSSGIIGLPLRLLADPGRQVARLYGATSWLPNRAARAVVVIDAEGRLRYRRVQPLSLFRPQDEEVLAAIRAASAERATSV